MGRLFLTACEIKLTSLDALHRTLHLWSLSLFCYKLHLPQLRSRNDILGSHLKVNFKKCDLRSLYRDYLCSATTLKKEINTFVCLDCEASVSNWVIAWKLEREQKKKNARGRGWGWGVEKRKQRFLLSLPFPLHPSCLLSPQLSRRTHSETLAMQTIVCPRVFFLACCCHEKSDVIRYISKIKIWFCFS